MRTVFFWLSDESGRHVDFKNPRIKFHVGSNPILATYSEK